MSVNLRQWQAKQHSETMLLNPLQSPYGSHEKSVDSYRLFQHPPLFSPIEIQFRFDLQARPRLFEKGFVVGIPQNAEERLYKIDMSPSSRRCGEERSHSPTPRLWPLTRGVLESSSTTCPLLSSADRLQCLASCHRVHQPSKSAHDEIDSEDGPDRPD